MGPTMPGKSGKGKKVALDTFFLADLTHATMFWGCGVMNSDSVNLIL
jgi:hypothetical protein